MTTPNAEIAEWLETIADEQARQAVAAAYDIASQADLPEEEADEYTPFVYPH